MTTAQDDDQLDWDRTRDGRMAELADDPEHELVPEDPDDEQGV